ncbi:MAG: hypothetical protein ACYDEW_00860 [Vulcanimicrobiaceae bacterium]
MFQKIDLQRLLADLRVQLLDIEAAGFGVPLAVKDLARSLEQLRFLLNDRIRMDVEALGKIRGRLVALDWGGCPLALKAAVWLRRERFTMTAPFLRSFRPLGSEVITY